MPPLVGRACRGRSRDSRTTQSGTRTRTPLEVAASDCHPPRYPGVLPRNGAAGYSISGGPSRSAESSDRRPYPSRRPRDGKGRVPGLVCGPPPARSAPFLDLRRFCRYSNIRRNRKGRGDSVRGQGEVGASLHGVGTSSSGVSSVVTTDEFRLQSPNVGEVHRFSSAVARRGNQGSQQTPRQQTH